MSKRIVSPICMECNIWDGYETWKKCQEWSVINERRVVLQWKKSVTKMIQNWRDVLKPPSYKNSSHRQTVKRRWREQRWEQDISNKSHPTPHWAVLTCWSRCAAYTHMAATPVLPGTARQRAAADMSLHLGTNTYNYCVSGYVQYQTGNPIQDGPNKTK